MDEFEKLIADFKALPEQKAPSPTFMQIAGYPHYENVCSNILRFFFDTNEAHNLGNLLMRSLLECWALNKTEDLQLLSKHFAHTGEVSREVRLPDGKRIDLVIEAGDLVIVIENKIFHWLANDLAAYKSYIDDRFPSPTRKVFIVLGIWKELKLDSEKNDFESITYADFFSKLKLNIGEYLIKGDNRYITFLLDFMESIEKHYMENSSAREILKFLQENWASIDKLQDQYKSWKKQVAYKVNELYGKFDGQERDDLTIATYDGHTLLHVFEALDPKIAVECEIWFTQVQIRIYAIERHPQHFQRLKDLAAYSQESWIPYGTDHKGYYYVYRNDLLTELDLDKLYVELKKTLSEIRFIHNSPQ